MARGMRTDEKIILIAVDLFAKQGYHNTTVRQIAQRLEISNPTIYAHFKSKAEIGRRVIKLFETSYVDRLVESIRALPENAEIRINKAISWTGDFGAKNLELMLTYLSFRKDLLADPEFEAALISARLKHEACIEGILRLGMRQGLISKQLDPKVLASLYLATTRGMLQEWSESQHRLSGKEFLKAFRTVFFKGILSS